MRDYEADGEGLLDRGLHPTPKRSRSLDIINYLSGLDNPAYLVRWLHTQAYMPTSHRLVIECGLVALLGGCHGGASKNSSLSDGGTDGASTSDASSDATDASSDAMTSVGPTGQTACTDLVPAVPVTTGPTFHVSTTGNDNNNGSSAAQAFRTLGRALRNAVPGTRVQLGNGTYAQTGQLAISVNGTATEPIVITTEPGAKPVFDFTGASINGSAFTLNSCTYVFVDGITVANSPAAGLGFNGGSHVTLTRSVVHDIQNMAITLIGSYFVVAGNEVYNGAMLNLNNKNGSWWPGTVGSWYVNGTTPTTHVQYLQNNIHDTWGECLNLLFTDDVDVIGNNLHDCKSAHVYIDHGADVRVLHNRMYNAQAKFIGAGVSIDDESYSAYVATPEPNILVANNYFGKGLGYSLVRFEPSSWTAANNTWSHIHVVFNVLEANPITWNAVHGGTAPSDGVIAGNIFLGNPSFSMEDTAAWTISENDFAGGVPTQFAGHGNFTVAPTFVGPTDGSTLAGFDVTNAAALAVPYRAEVPDDALCANRTSPTTTAGVGP